MDRPAPPPEAQLIRATREAAHMTATDAARVIGITKSWWSAVEQGGQVRGGVYRPITGESGVVGRMAWAVGVSPERLEAAGRGDAVPVLEELLRQHGPRTPERPEGAPVFVDIDEQRLADQVWIDNATLPEDVRLGMISLAVQMRRAARDRDNSDEQERREA